MFSHSGAAIEEVMMYRSVNYISVTNDGGGERSHSFGFFIRLLFREQPESTIRTKKATLFVWVVRSFCFLKKENHFE